MSKQRGCSAHHHRRRYLCYWLFVALCGSGTAWGDCEQAAGRLESSEGSVSIEQTGSWQPIAIGACVPVGVRVQVSGGRAVFRLANETLLRAAGNTLLQFSAPEQKSWIHLFDGVLHFITRTPHAFDVDTDYVNAGVKGTEFILAANHAEHYGQVVMLEGEVLASNESGQQSVRGGAAVIAHEGQAPQLLTVPAIRGAVQWTLYYPPLPTVSEPRFQPVLERLQRSDAGGAIAQLESLPIADRDADYFALAASIDLHRGEVARARGELDSALALQPDHPSALALSAISALATGDAEQASALLDRAQAKTSRDATVLIARSYLEQTRFQLPAALKSARRAAASNPGDALIQARVAELALMNGDTRKAAIAANKSIGQQPKFARAHAINGFVLLQQLKFDAAEAEFSLAAKLNASDPMPRLGLGLINMRHNHVSEGREQLAVAVALDPGQSLLRSYLGKAYQEEGRERLASDQYILAKIFDDADPTPWFYSALLAQVQNRPFDALDDLNESMVRNDNRAVYRSRLQLDADEAARTASQAEIYRELGFDELAQITAARAVSTAPNEYGGHRQLAEAYADNPKYDAARSSEVLQAQLLQPLSATPIMPLLGETNLLATQGAGPSALGFREYNAMFVREQPWLSVSGLGGSNRTGADEIALSGIYDRVAYALNQYHYETAGYRENNDARYDVLSAYAKWQATEDLSFLLQWSRREEDLGNMRETLFDEGVPPFLQAQSVSHTVLGGSRLKLGSGIDMLALAGFQDTDKVIHTNNSIIDRLDDLTRHVSNAEIQWQFSDLPGHLIAGVDFGRMELDSDSTTAGLYYLVPNRSMVEDTERYKAGYAYWTISPFSTLELTAGVTYAELDAKSPVNTLSGLQSKLSVSYKPNENLGFRTAYFQSLKRPFSIEQTLEPTQLGGFNQFNDEANGVESENYALGFDFRADGGHHFGVEYLLRNSYIPFPVPPDSLLQVKSGDVQIFWNWAIDPWALSLTYHYEDNEYTLPPLPPGLVITYIPDQLITQSVPFQVKWIHQGGFSVAANTTYFYQKMESSVDGRITTHFTLLDLVASYRFMRQQAEVELRCNNLFDKEFVYQNEDPSDATPQISPYIPERTYGVVFKIAY
jgi:Flp pilus assembly protein TadD